MKKVRILLAIFVALGVIYLAVYGVMDLRSRFELGGRAREAAVLRDQASADQNIPAAETDATAFADVTAQITPTATGQPAKTEAPAVTDVPTRAPEAATEAPAVEVTEAPEAATDAPAVEATEAPEAATDAPTEKPTEAPTDEPEAESTAVPTSTPTPDPLLEYYDGLYRQNSDMVGWLYVEGTVIDYPVMHTPEDGEFYLHRSFEKKNVFAGTPFVDERCDMLDRSDNVIIYAHNMKNGTMFGQLSRFLEADFFEEHLFVNFDTLNERGEYLIFAVVPVYMAELGDERMRCYGVSMTEDEMQIEALKKYLDVYAVRVRDEALPKVGDDILTLSTCTGFRDADRLVVMAKKVR